MTRNEAMKIAKDLSQAVASGVLPENEARRLFRVIAYNYRQQKKLRRLQLTHPELWVKACAILGG